MRQKINRNKRDFKAVLFDLGKVLFHFNFEPAFKKLAHATHKTPEDIRLFFSQSELEVLYDGGKISSSQFYLKVKKYLGLTISYGEFKEAWNDIFTPINPMIDLVNKLYGRKRLVLISNTNSMHYEFIKNKYAVLNKFDRHILSFKEKIRKPDPKIYAVAAKACKAEPCDIFYIDDRDDLTSAAKDLGFHVHTFRNDPEILLNKLKSKGIL